MANYFIGGVGRVRAFVKTEAGLQHYFDAKTLTDSAISISTSAEEIRGGEGAQLLGKFFHTSVFNLNMTDALFDLKYLAAQIGDDINNQAYGKHFYTEKLKVGADGLATLNKIAVPISSDTWCQEQADTIAWFKECDDTEYTTAVVEGNKIAASKNGVALAENTEICVTYPINKAGRQIVVNAMYYPKEFVVYLTAKLFAGDACKPSTGSAIGEIVVEIPRFQLDGAVDLSLNMSSPATMALNGSAYAVDCGCSDEAKPYYAKITEVMFDEANLYQGYTDIQVFGAEELNVGDAVYIYATATGKTPKYYNGEFTATYVSQDKTLNALDGNNVIIAPASSEVTVTITGENSLKGKTATFTVQA